MILCPTSRKDGKSRIVAIGKKHLPSVPKRERLFGALPAALHAAGHALDVAQAGLGSGQGAMLLCMCIVQEAELGTLQCLCCTIAVASSYV